MYLVSAICTDFGLNRINQNISSVGRDFVACEFITRISGSFEAFEMIPEKMSLVSQVVQFRVFACVTHNWQFGHVGWTVHDVRRWGIIRRVRA